MTRVKLLISDSWSNGGDDRFRLYEFRLVFRDSDLFPITSLASLAVFYRPAWCRTEITHLAVRVDIDPLIIIAQQELHPISIGQSDDGVRSHRALGVFGQVDVVHTEIL